MTVLHLTTRGTGGSYEYAALLSTAEQGIESRVPCKTFAVRFHVNQRHVNRTFNFFGRKQASLRPRLPVNTVPMVPAVLARLAMQIN
jgi:hypothetical protein